MFKSYRGTFIAMLAGILVLLVICVYLFDGTMIPAMWQLSSIGWVCFCVTQYDYADCKIKTTQDRSWVEQQVEQQVRHAMKRALIKE